MRSDSIHTFLTAFKDSAEVQTLIKLTLSKSKLVNELKNIYVKPVLIKNEFKLSFTYRFKTNDRFANYSIAEAIVEIQSYIEESRFLEANLITESSSIKLEFLKSKKWKLTETQKETIALNKADLSHNRVKKRLLSDSDLTWMYDLGLTNENGEVFKNAQDKYKQINHYIELLKPDIEALNLNKNIHVMDMGSGKGYLTFALYSYLQSRIQESDQTNESNVYVKGVEYRADLVDFCNKTADNCSYANLSFIKGGIIDTPINELTMLVALHACDTATDDAIYKGIVANADLIVVAPCCHKQIRREMEKSSLENELSPLTRHGIFLERQAEMVTDTIRGLILEYYGYQIRVMQFISDAHTPKNVMITAIKKDTIQKKNEEAKEKIQKIKAYFGIQSHYLEELLAEY